MITRSMNWRKVNHEIWQNKIDDVSETHDERKPKKDDEQQNVNEFKTKERWWTTKG